MKKIEMTEEESDKKKKAWAEEKLRRKEQKKERKIIYTLCAFCKKTGAKDFKNKGISFKTLVDEHGKRIKDENGRNILYHEKCFKEYLARMSKIENETIKSDDYLSKKIWANCQSIQNLNEKNNPLIKIRR